MQVVEIWTPSCGFPLPATTCPVDELRRCELVALITDAVLRNDATFPDPQAAARRTGLGDPTEPFAGGRGIGQQ